MDSKEAVKIIHEMQKWRRRRNGVGFDPMPYSPKEYGRALDVAIRALRKEIRDEHKQERDRLD